MELGIPYGFIDPDTGEQICPKCQARFQEAFDSTGEQTTDHYAEHYLAEHAKEGI